MQRSILQPSMNRLSQLGVASSFLLLCGCATLPSSGPTGREIQSAARTATNEGMFDVIRLTDLNDVPDPAPVYQITLPTPFQMPTNLIGTGDVLAVSIYEAGISLFGGAGGQADLSGTKVERLPAIRVDSSGSIQVPFVGRIQASGRTTSELEAEIRTALRGLSENPQVLVTIQETVGNSVILGGEVARPGRLPLPTNRETLLDAIALAGGYRGAAKDLIVTVERQGEKQEMRLSDLEVSEVSDVLIQPGDRINVLNEPLTFSVMGAPGRAQQFPFSSRTLSLTEALAIAGGSNPTQGDPKAIFVFRFIAGPDGEERPVVYHVNMMEPESFFLSQRFAMRDKDLLYVGNAAANQPSKFIQILSQLFTPVILARQLTD